MRLMIYGHWGWDDLALVYGPIWPPKLDSGCHVPWIDDRGLDLILTWS